MDVSDSVGVQIVTVCSSRVSEPMQFTYTPCMYNNRKHNVPLYLNYNKITEIVVSFRDIVFCDK